MTRVDTPLPAAPVPDLDVRRLTARREHLVGEIGDGAPRRSRRRRLAVSAATGTAVAASVATVVAIVSGVAGPTAPQALAGWTPTPTVVPVTQQSPVRTACQAAITASDKPGTASSGPWHLVLAEQRGPTRFAVLTSGASRVACLSLAGAGTSITRWSIVGAGQPGVDTATVERLAHAVHAGVGFSFVEGTVGTSVASVRLRLSDGRVVTASISSSGTAAARVFAAWWPSDARLASLLVTTGHGTTTQAGPSPAPSTTS
jgi:hypothetical protein